MTTVAAALIQRQGRVLICRRRADQDHAGKWEFPGGKLETGETPAACLRRELAEELGIDAVVGNEITRYRFQYPGRKEIQLVFFAVAEYRGNPDYGMFAEVRWAPLDQMPAFDFLEGDVEFVNGLAAGGFDLSGLDAV
jgi:8-oxo-dGTP diphosphatase